MAQIFDTGIFSANAPNGAIGVGYKLHFYAAGTTTPLATYADAALATPNANPVVAAADGRFGPIYLSPANYKYVLMDADDVVLMTRDNFSGSISSGDTLISHSASYSSGTVGQKLQQLINPLDAPYNAAGNGSTNDAAALAAADTAAVALGAPLFITKTHRVSSDLTLQSDLIFIGGKLSPDSTKTITCRGEVSAPLAQIFTGAGAVVGIRQVKPEWWGAAGNGSTNDQPALQAAHDCVEQSFASRGGRPTIALGAAKSYGLGGQLKWRPTANINLCVDGAGPLFTGSRFVALSSFSTANGGAAILIEGNADTIQQIASFKIGGFAVVPSSGTASTCGLFIGSPPSEGKDLIGVEQSEIHDVHISDGFADGMLFGQVRQVDFNRCSSWNRSLAGSNCARFYTNATNSFCGDLNFNTCQFVSHTSATGVSFNIAQSGAQVKGIRFNSSIFYHANKGIDFSPSDGAQVGDIWINAGCQFDGQQNYGIFGEPTDTGTVLDNINIEGAYFRGINAGQIAVHLAADGLGRMDAINVSSNWFANLGIGARSVRISDASNISVNFNRHTECNASTQQLILFNDTASFTCMGNTLRQVTAINVDYLITVGTGCDYGAVVHNSALGAAISGPVQNLSAGTHLTLTPNW